MLAAVGLSAGCATTLTVRVQPTTAVLTLPDGTQATSPATVRVAKGAQPLVVEAQGYRTLTVDLRRAGGGLIRKASARLVEDGSRDLVVVLVEDHLHVGETPLPESEAVPEGR